MQQPSKLGSDKRSFYERDTHHLNLVVDLNVLLIFFGGFGHFFFMISRVERFASSHKQVRDIL